MLGVQPYFRDAVPGDVPAIVAILSGTVEYDDARRRRTRVALAGAGFAGRAARGGFAHADRVGRVDRGDRGARGDAVEAYRAALAEIDRTDGNYVLVAEYDSQIIAVAQLVSFRRLDQCGRRAAELVSLHVAEPFRTSGIAGMLVDHVAERAAELGCRDLRVVSRTAGSGEHAAWERWGFVHLDRGYVRVLD